LVVSFLATVYGDWFFHATVGGGWFMAPISGVGVSDGDSVGISDVGAD